MSKIAWTEQTWNPIVGCSIASKGCKNCYAMKMAARLEAMGTDHYAGTTKKVNGKPVWTGKMAMAPESTLLKPLKRKKPTTYFVNSMGDLFHEDVPDEWIDKVFSIMSLCPQHTFQVLTKRAQRMREYFEYDWRFAMIEGNAQSIHHDLTGEDPSMWLAVHDLPNVWLGVSAEDQEQANKRIPHLLDTPAAIRFVSLEPQLEEIDLYRGGWSLLRRKDIKGKLTGKLDWIIQGCESGPGARGFDMYWAKSMRDQCAEVGVPYFLKQAPVLFEKSNGWIKRNIEEKPFLDGIQHLAMPDLKKDKP